MPRASGAGDGIGLALVNGGGQDLYRNIGNVTNINRSDLRTRHRQEQRPLPENRRDLPEVRGHELAGAQVGESHAGLFQHALDLSVHAREPKCRVPFGHDPGELHNVCNPRLLRSLDEAHLDILGPGPVDEMSMAFSTPFSAPVSVSRHRHVTFHDLDARQRARPARAPGSHQGAHRDAAR